MPSLDIRSWIDRHIDGVSRLLILAAVGWWALGEFVPLIHTWPVYESLWPLVMVALLIEVIHRLSDLKATGGDLTVFRDQGAALPRLLEYLDSHTPRKADFILQSSVSMRPVVYKLANQGTPVLLLVQHPLSAISKHKGKHIRDTIVGLQEDLSGRRVTILCYRSPASIRGCRLGDQMIAMGWYRYDSGAPGVLHGDGNAVIVASLSCEEGRVLDATYGAALEALVSARDTVDASVALEEWAREKNDSSLRKKRRERAGAAIREIWVSTARRGMNWARRSEPPSGSVVGDVDDADRPPTTHTERPAD